MKIVPGARVFAAPCTGTKLWRDTLFSNVKLMHDAIDPDCLFLDCFGAFPTCPCFNDAHEHGPRVDHEWIFRRQFYGNAADYCDRVGRTLATGKGVSYPPGNLSFNITSHRPTTTKTPQLPQ